MLIINKPFPITCYFFAKHIYFISPGDQNVRLGEAVRTSGGPGA